MTTRPPNPTPGPPDWDSIPPALREQMNISREAFEEVMAAMVEREKLVPAVGSEAPDFDLVRLDEQGAVTTDRLCLADLRGRPVALVFGSYT